MRRSAGDYYDSKPSVNNKGRRSSGFSTSSRPSSSLSQRSSFNADQDQQVSFQLEKFEEASLRGSLSRWTYRDPCSSSNFAVNPLLRMVESPDRVHEAVKDRNEISLGNDNRDEKSEKVAEGEINNDEYEIADKREIEDVNEILEEIGRDLERNNNLNTDRDSGMSSVDTNDSKVEKKEDCWRRLWIDDFRNVGNEQIVSLNGRRYFNSNGYKYNTFGGIKKHLSIDELSNDSDEDNSKQPERSDEFFDPGEFAGLKFHTFGGVKGSKKVDRRGILMYRRVTLRSSVRNGKNVKGMGTSRSDSLFQVKDRISEDRQIDDYRSDDSEEKDRSAKYLDKKPRRRGCNKFYKRQKTKIIYTSSTSTDDDWQDEEVLELPDKVIMQKFLKDTSKKMKSNSDNDPNYFLNTSRKKIFNNSIRAPRSPKHRSSDDNESLKLEPPIVPEVIEKSFESLQDLRGKGKGKKKRKASESIKYVGVRSLSDLTIW